MADAFIAEIRAFPYTYVPAGWLLCDGSEYKIQEYQALYALISTIYGTTSTPTLTFKVPDLTGQTAVGTGANSGSQLNFLLGRNYGNQTTTLTVDNLPSHTHQITLKYTSRTSTTNNYASAPTEDVSWLGRYYREDGSGAFTSFNTFHPTMSSTTVADPTNPVAWGPLEYYGNRNYGEVSNLQPYCTLRYCICWEGYFPETS